MKSQLQKKYQKYRKSAQTKRKNLSFLRSFMNEIVFRTTKLEGEPVTRRMVKAIFGWKNRQPSQRVQLPTDKPLLASFLDLGY